MATPCFRLFIREASASEHNKFMKDRASKLSTAGFDPATFTAEAYKEWREKDSRKNDGSIADDYGTAMRKFQAAKLAAENGQKISQDGLSSVEEGTNTKPDGSNGRG